MPCVCWNLFLVEADCSVHHQYYSAVTTFDILRNYANLSQETISDLEDVIDDPSNGFLLELNAHVGFDRFQWCLQPTEVCNN
jgi:hypothetical protein